jgi:hypothetical protein
MPTEEDFDLTAAGLRADGTDLRISLEVLASKLEEALPQHTHVERHGGGLLGRGEKRVRRLRVDLGGSCYARPRRRPRRGLSRAPGGRDLDQARAVGPGGVGDRTGRGSAHRGAAQRGHARRSRDCWDERRGPDRPFGPRAGADTGAPQARAAADERRQAESLARIEQGGIPLAAEAGLHELGERGGSFTSDLSVADFALCHQLGLRPARR